MKAKANVLTRKLGPLPFWAWAVLAGGVIYWYRNRQAASTGVLGYTGPVPGAQGPPGPTGPPGTTAPSPGSAGGRKHHPKPHKKRKKLHLRKKHPRRSHAHVDDHAHGHHKAVAGHHTGAQHTHRAKPKRIIGKGRGSHVTHSGVHHELHGNRQTRNEPHHRNDHLMVTPTKHTTRNERQRSHGIRAALTSVSPIPRGAGRPRVGAMFTAEGRNRGGELARVPHGQAPPRTNISRNRIPNPPMQGHVSRQARPAEAARPIVLRGGRNPEHAEAARTPHTTAKQPGVVGGARGTRRVRGRAV